LCSLSIEFQSSQLISILLGFCLYMYVCARACVLNKTGDRPYPCLTPLFVSIDSDICASVNLMHISVPLCKLFSASVSCVGMFYCSICHSILWFKLSNAFL
jgi:hypothetical protein